MPRRRLEFISHCRRDGVRSESRPRRRPHRPRPRPRRALLRRPLAPRAQGSNQWLVINKNASNPDEKYWLSAAVDLAILAAIIFFFLWAEKSLRRARKARRAESAEEPDDVEMPRSPQ